MTTPTRAAERTLTAFLDGPDSLDITNIIHSTEGAAAYGYRGALVGGVTVYGWLAPSIIELFGERWLDEGWVDVSFRRPVYPGDTMTARIDEAADGSATLSMTNQDGAACLTGTLGLANAPFADLYVLPVRREPEPRPEQLPVLTPETAPVGEDLRPMKVHYNLDDARAYATDKQRDTSPLWMDHGGRIHPGWIAARMTPLIHHSYDYGPAIHSRSQIQNLRPALIGQSVTVAGHFIEQYERKGHHYAVVDGVILSESGEELAHLRHTTIFQVAKRG